MLRTLEGTSTLVSVDCFARDVRDMPGNHLRQIPPAAAASQQHFGDQACQHLAASDAKQMTDVLENAPQTGDDFQNLSRLIAAWPSLPAHARTTILQFADALASPPTR